MAPRSRRQTKNTFVRTRPDLAVRRFDHSPNPNSTRCFHNVKLWTRFEIGYIQTFFSCGPDPVLPVQSEAERILSIQTLFFRKPFHLASRGVEAGRASSIGTEPEPPSLVMSDSMN